MFVFTPAVLGWLSSHHGVITRDRLLALGVSRHQLARLLRTGVLVVHTRSVYRLAAVPTSADQALALACAVDPTVVISHRSAGHVWGLRRLGSDQRLHVTLSGRQHHVVPGAVIHLSHRIDPVDVVERPGGVRVTSPPRTVFDLAATVSDDQLGSIIEQVLHEGLCSLPTLFSTARRLRASGRNGSARFGRVLHSRPAWLKPVASDLELRFEQAAVAAGLPRPLRQHPIALPSGDVIHPDFYWPEQHRVVEIDHVTWHGGKLDATYDKRRDRALERIGIRTTRITDSEIRDGLSAAIDDLRALLTRSRAAKVS